MRVLSLFSGGGLGDFGLELAGMEIVGQVEIDDYCQKILKLRWPDVPKWGDIKKVKGKELPQCDLISGGFPCQPFSSAGDKRGENDDRSLWPEMLRIIRAKAPSWVIAENVPGIVSLYLDEVLDDLESCGYSAITLDLPACAFGKDHIRQRIFVLAHTRSDRLHGSQEKRDHNKKRFILSDESKDWSGIWGEANGRLQTNSQRPKNAARVRGGAHGLTERMERIRLLGNGQVVQVVQWIGEKIMEFQNAQSHR